MGFFERRRERRAAIIISRTLRRAAKAAMFASRNVDGGPGAVALGRYADALFDQAEHVLDEQYPAPAKPEKAYS